MKISPVVVLCVLCVMLHGVAAETNQEICFLGIPWGSDIITYTQTVKKEMGVQENNAATEIKSRSFGFFFDETELEMFKAYSFKDDEGLFYSTVLTYDLEMSMYGYPVDFIHVEAVSSQAQECAPENSAVLNSICSLDRKKIPDLGYTHHDVFDALCSTYGTPDTIKTQEGYSIEYVWYGAQDTYCNLSVGLNSKGTEGNIIIRHGTTRIDLQ